MNVWILIEGEKLGPVPDYEVRKSISEGEFTRETVGWHAGCEGWMPLARMALFEREFPDIQPERMEGLSEAAGTAVRGEWVPGAYWMRRFWGRWLDLHLFSGVCWLGLYVGGASIGAVLANVWIMLLLYLPWVPLEAYLIARYRTTPGKWLAGVRIVRPDGGNLDFAVSLRRALRVYFLGIGMGWGIISMICQSVSLVTVRGTGRAAWDREGSHVLEGKPWKPMRGVLVVAAYILVTQMQWIVVAPYFMEDMAKRHPKWHEWMTKNPPRHLPRKD